MKALMATFIGGRTGYHFDTCEVHIGDHEKMKCSCYMKIDKNSPSYLKIKEEYDAICKK